MQAVASELNAVWEEPLQRQGGVLLVLSDSAIRTLEALRAGGSALHGRLDWSDRLRPFGYLDAGRMVPECAPLDRLRAYAAFGGVPSYLASIDAIAAHTGEPLGTPLRRMVERLVDLELLEVVGRIDEKRTHARRYRIADPALRTHYGLVAQAYRRFAAACGFPAPATWGSWTATGHGRGWGQGAIARGQGTIARGQDAITWGQGTLEIDVAVRTLDGTALTG